MRLKNHYNSQIIGIIYSNDKNKMFTCVQLFP